MDNTVSIKIDGKDDSGGAFASAISREKALAAITDANSQKELTAASRSERALRTREDAFARVTRAMHFMNQEADKALKIQGDLDKALSGGSGGGFFSRLLHRGGGFSGLWGLAGAGSGGGAGLGGAGAWGIGGLAALAAALAPSVIPFGLGGLVAGGGALGALKLAGSVQTQLFSQEALLNSIKALQQSAKPLTAAQQRTLSLDEAKYRSSASVGELRALYEPLAKFQNTFQGLGQTVMTTFAKALGSGGSNSFLSGMDAILKQVSGFVKSIGPQLGNLFRASLPFASAFVKIMEQFGRAVLPVVVQMLRQMTPFLPIMVQGFRLLSQGLAGFLRNLGPGMKDSAIIFKAAMTVMVGFLDLFGWALGHFSIIIVKAAEAIRAFARGIPPAFNAAVSFLSRFFTVDIPSWVHTGVHWFTDAVNWIKSAWNSLPGWAQGIGSAIIHGLISGIQSAVPGLHSVLSWVSGLIPSWKGPLDADRRMLFPHGQAIMQGLMGGISSQLPALHAQMGAVTAIAGAPGGGGGALAGGHGGGLTIEFHMPPGAGVLGNDFWTAFANGIRVRGGSKEILTRKVVFA